MSNLFMPKKIVKRFKYATVAENKSGKFDVWQWNVWKLKWVRLVSSCFGTIEQAALEAQVMSNEVERMLENNKHDPEPM